MAKAQNKIYEIIFIGNIEIKVPVIQGGMGVGISLSGLASAVANEGEWELYRVQVWGLLYPKEKGTYTEKMHQRPERRDSQNHA